jgi:hypothetical protein
MTTPLNPDLLRPSLSDTGQVAAAPYTLQTSFFSAFFGGPFASAAMLLLNARRLGRLQRDLGWAMVIAIAFVAWLVYVYTTPAGHALQVKLAEWVGGRSMALAERLMALLAFALNAALHRREQRSADLFGLKRPNGWIAGIALIVFGFAATVGLTMALI